MKKLLFILLLTISSISKVLAGGGGGGPTIPCTDALPFCTQNTYSFPNETNTTAPTGPNYDCLGSQPNPVWFFMEIDQGGPMTFTISQSTTQGGSANLDVDFALWGPFSSLSTGCNSVTSGSAYPIDCSFSIDPVETVSIGNAVAGQTYIIIITNYDGGAGFITFNQTGGSGIADCSIVTPCDMTNLTSVPSACNPANNTYGVTGQVTFVSPPATGTLTVSSSCGGTQTFNAPFASPLNYSLTGITSNGAACVVTATFSADNTCTRTSNYTAPAPCLPCNMTGITTNVGACNPANNQYAVSGNISFTNPPSTGTLTITNSCGGTQTFNAPFASPAAYNFTGLTSNGGPCSITAAFSANAACTISQNYTAPANCIPPCLITNLNATIGSCQPNNTFPVTGTFTYNNNPGTGTVVVTVTNSAGSQTQTFNPPFVNNQTYNFNITTNVSNGSPVTVTVAFSNAPACTLSVNSTSPPACGCVADIGTFTASITGVSTNNYVLCFDDEINITDNGDYTPPGQALAPPNPGGYEPGITWLVYSCPPTIAVTPSNVPPNDWIGNDPCLLGLYSDFDLYDINDQYWMTAFPPGTFTNNTVYFVPITMYNLTEGLYSYVNTSTDCYEMGAPFAVQYLPNITFTQTQTCTNVTATITGGLPAVNGSQFTASGLTPANASFVNTTANNGGTIGITGLTPGQAYSFTVQDANGCPKTISGTFVGGPTLSYPQAAYCPVGSANPTITGAAGGTYTSTPAGLSINASTGVINLAVSTPNTYTVTYTTPAVPGPACPTTFVVTVNPLPVITANNVTVCQGGTIAVTATGANTYSWAPATYLSATTGASVNFVNGVTTNYTVTGTDANGCVNTDPVTVTVNGNAPINAGPDVAICIGASTTITASGGVTYNWDNTLGSGASHTVSPTSTTTYTVNGTDANGCLGSDAMTVTVNPLPIVNAGTDQTVCAGASVTLTAIGASTYSWNNGVVQGVSFVPASTNTYTVSGTSAAGCVSTDQVIVNVNPLPVVLAGNDQTICIGTSVTLNATGASTYSWNNGVNQGVSFTPAATNTYTVSGTDANGCVNSDAVIVNVNPLPAVNAGIDQTVCAGTNITLSGSGASTYTWSGGITNGIAFTQPVGQTTYTVTGTDANNCVNTDQIVVTVNPNPTPVINGPTEYCLGSFAVLSTSQPYTAYNWSTGGTGATINATAANNPITVTVTDANGCQGLSPAFNVIENNVITANFNVTICQGASALIHGVNQTVGGVYSQTFLSAEGCDSISNVTLTVNPLPAVNAGTDQFVCIGGSVTLTATGASTYSWSGGITNGTPFIPATNTTYTVSGTSAQGCVNTDQVLVTVNLLPIVNAGLDTEACIGETVTLNGSGAQTYVWNLGVIDGVAFVPPGTSTYTVTGTDVNGCVGSDQINVTINPLPDIDAGPDQTVCIGNTVTLFATGGLNYAWNNGVANGVPFTPAVGSLTYTVTGTDLKGCINTDQVVVNVNPLPTVDAGPDQTICLGESITLNGAGASTYNWSGGITNGTPFTPPISTIYTVSGTDANGCINTDDVSITVNPIPSVSAGPDQSVCEGTSVTINGANASTYSWSGGVADGVAFVPPVGTNSYTVTGTSAFGCTFTDVVVIIVNPTPTVFAGNDVAVCDGETVTLTASGASIYTWDNSVNNGVAFVPSVGTLTYTVTGTTAAGCIDTDQVTVTVNPNPVVSFLPDITLGCVPFTVNFTNTTVDASDCIWTFSNGTVLNGCGTVPVTFTQGGCYDATLTTTSANGCTSTMTAPNIVCGEEAPIAEFSPSSNQLSTLDTEVLFTNNTIGAENYTWTFGDNSQSSNAVNPSHIYPDDEIGSYNVTLIAYSPLGCTDTAYSVIQVYEELIFYVPNTFTPDIDDYNPVFKPIFTSGFDPQDYVLYIYNRWGELIFESRNSEVGWNGSYGKNGEIELCQDGTYTWKIEFKVTRWDERKVSVGHVNLIR
jgi:gliding motility-associated-like protein